LKPQEIGGFCLQSGRRSIRIPLSPLRFRPSGGFRPRLSVLGLLTVNNSSDSKSVRAGRFSHLRANEPGVVAIFRRLTIGPPGTRPGRCEQARPHEASPNSRSWPQVIPVLSRLRTQSAVLCPEPQASSARRRRNWSCLSPSAAAPEHDGAILVDGDLDRRRLRKRSSAIPPARSFAPERGHGQASARAPFFVSG